MATIIAYAQFIASKAGKNGIVVTWDIEQITRSDGTRAALVTGGATNVIIGRRGLYGYRLTGADITLYDYVFTAITADGTVDQQELAAMWTLWSLSWHDIATSIMTVVGSIGKWLVDLVDSIWDEPLTGATHNVPTSSGRRLRQLASAVTIDGTVVSSTVNTVVLDAGASAVDDAYDPSVILVIDGPASGQARLILQYIGASRTCIIDRDWKVNPSPGDEYYIFSNAGREHVNEGLAQGGGVQTITLNALASNASDSYIGQVVFIRSGTGQDQARRVLAYDGTTKIATVGRPWSTIPDATSAYVMLPSGAITDDNIANAVWDALIVDHMDTGSTGETLAYNYAKGSIEFTYTVLTPGALPIESVSVWITTDLAGTNVIWRGETDVFGVARDVKNVKPWLDAGTYYFWCQHANYSFSNPDTEVVS